MYKLYIFHYIIPTNDLLFVDLFHIPFMLETPQRLSQLLDLRHTYRGRHDPASGAPAVLAVMEALRLVAAGEHEKQIRGVNHVGMMYIYIYIISHTHTSMIIMIIHIMIRLAKAAGAEPSGQMRDEKLHAVVARSAFGSQHVQNTSASDHFWKLRCRKSARCCGTKHICK